MKKILILSLFFTVQGCSSMDIDQLMERYLWRNRVVIVFSDSEDNPNFVDFNLKLKNQTEALLERDVVVWTIVDRLYVKMGGEALPHAIAHNFFEHYNVLCKGAHVVLLGKDGEVKLTTALPFNLDQLFQIIDAMPMRAQEIRDKNK